VPFATPDHYIPTHSRSLADVRDPEAALMAQALADDTAAAGIPMFGVDDIAQGIVHVVRPSRTVAAGLAHRVRRQPHVHARGVAALAFGIGASEVAHVLATQTIWQRRPKTLRHHDRRRACSGVSARRT
jgi:3-isopropylmalate/(R)-2-methylmalate dehydratase large subunit